MSDKANKKIPVIEIFGPTVQGEGVMFGRLTFFVRAGLCDYKCTSCDSMHAVDPKQVKEGAMWMTQEEIAKELIDAMGHIEWVTLSGGNPCIHDLGHLVSLLQDAGKKVAVETQGTLLPYWLLDVDQITVSPKSPFMGVDFEPDAFVDYVRTFGSGMCVKVVVASAADLEFAASIRQMMQKHDSWTLYLSQGNPFLNPEEDLSLMRNELLNNYSMIVEEVSNDKRLGKVVVLPQLHVLTWGNALCK